MTKHTIFTALLVAAGTVALIGYNFHNQQYTESNLTTEKMLEHEIEFGCVRPYIFHALYKPTIRRGSKLLRSYQVVRLLSK